MATIHRTSAAEKLVETEMQQNCQCLNTRDLPSQLCVGCNKPSLERECHSLSHNSRLPLSDDFVNASTAPTICITLCKTKHSYWNTLAVSHQDIYGRNHFRTQYVDQLTR